MRSRSTIPMTLLAGSLLVGAAACSGTSHDAAHTPDTADATIRHIAENMADGQPQVLWHALPASYQEDVNGLLRDISDNMDAEVWNKTFALLDKTNTILDTKREFILSHPMIAQQLDSGEAAESWDSVVELMDIIFKSELADLDSLGSLDVENFLTGTGARFMEQMERVSEMSPNQGPGTGLSGYRNVNAKLLESDGDTARVIIEKPDGETTQENWVRVEGKWISSKMADTWESQIADARSKITEMSSSNADTQTVLMQLNMADGVLDTLLAANTAQEFNNGLSSAMGMVMGAMMANQGGGFPSTEHPSTMPGR